VFGAIGNELRNAKNNRPHSRPLSKGEGAVIAGCKLSAERAVTSLLPVKYTGGATPLSCGEGSGVRTVVFCVAQLVANSAKHKKRKKNFFIM
jgi:hypothetical protein